MGEIDQGGVIFYSGATVLIAALEDVYMPRLWDKSKVAVATETGIGSGAANTAAIIAACTGNTMIAASACTTYSYSGLTDWYLPSKDELNEMYTQRAVIGGFDVYTNYWSSSQYTPETAWIQFFTDGTQSHLGGKDQLYKVRPIRTMT